MMMEIAERMDDNDNDDKPNILKCKKNPDILQYEINIYTVCALFFVFFLAPCRPLEHPFKCKSGMCIPEVLQCNGVEDCDDGTDETVGCSKYIIMHSSDVDFLSVAVSSFTLRYALPCETLLATFDC